MRRNILLYINDSLADLSEDNLILLNYKAEELTKPSIVANSYSHQVTLPLTRNNNRIFEHFKRSDRVTGTGFDAMRKTPFRILNENGELLEHGYIKLDEVGEGYKITLYGGLGSFFYGLSYDANGNKKSLASLDYGGGVNEFNITINRETIKRAWYSLRTNQKNSTYHKINFAPCYNGIPNNNFDAKKVIIDVDKAKARTGNNSLFPSAIDGQSPYLSKYALMEMEDNRNEWIMTDLRSYLQRPVVNVQAVLDAISNPLNNGGYNINWHTALPLVDETTSMWCTLKSLSSIDLDREESRTIDTGIDYQYNTYRAKEKGNISVFDNLPLGLAEVGVSFTPKISDTRTLYFSGENRGSSHTTYHITGFVFQLVAYGEGDTPIGYSPILVVSNPVSVHDMTWIADTFVRDNRSELYGDTIQTLESHFENGELVAPVTLSFSCNNIKRVELHSFIDAYGAYSSYSSHLWGLTTSKSNWGIIQPNWGITINEGSNATITQSSVRSGMQLTKTDLLNTEYTPADFLLSVAKMYHWHFYAEDEHTIGVYPSQIADKDNIIDLSKVIDLTTSPVITPVFANARWFSLSLPIYGAKAKTYKERYGIEYGAKKVNTGYEFNTDTTDLMSGSVFKGAVQVLENSPLYSDITNGKGNWLNVFRQKYTLQYGTGNDAKSQDFLPEIATSLAPFNPYYPNYDTFAKVQLCDKENKPESGEGVLLVLMGHRNWTQTTKEYTLTDDNTTLFNALNDGKPCWLLDWDSSYLVQGLDMPNFNRYILTNYHNMRETLDFSLSNEMYNPSISYIFENRTIYDLHWRKYMNDRYNPDTRVMKCKVDLTKMKVDTDLFKRFWWYDNALWVLNRIDNYSITTLDSTDCEFIKVNDKDNY